MSAPAGSRFAKSLDDEVQYLKGVGPKNAELLAKLGVKTVRDVLYYLPRRYEDRTNLPPIGSLRPGVWATVRGKLLGLETRQTRGGKVILRAMVSDGSGTLALVWFNQPWIKRRLEKFKGEIIAFGQAKEAGWSYEFHRPEFEIVDPQDSAEEFSRIVPVYPLTEGLSQWPLRKAALSALANYRELLVDPLPQALLREHALKPLDWCLEQAHRPTSEAERLEARRRLVFEEFLYLQLALAMQRSKVHREPGIAFPITELGGWKQSPESADGLRPDPNLPGTPRVLNQANALPLREEVRAMLPFELTRAQSRVIAEIWRDMESPHPMNRLLQGDVGSGKTAVAACAMLAAVRSGYQCAIMAPTEVLAEQHAMTFRRLFEPLGIKVETLLGKLSGSQKSRARQHAESGAKEVFVGTHALIQEGLEFKRLGLAVIDEQHRFGVIQRATLRGKGLGNPDVLVMTATPIPRTLTMTLYGDLDLSVIDEMPPGRKPVKTHWKQPAERSSVYAGVRKLVERGMQAYVVCPLVGESEKMLALAATDLHYRLEKEEFPDLRVGLLHGQLRPKHKEEVMERFRKGEIQILVSTTVIEVGVDVPNATVMVIEDANRFGLSQLHQLRGRVGRSSAQSFCVLIAEATTEEARARLNIMVQTTDGFKIAEEDLRIRGPGELMGTKQHGNLGLKVADLVRDGQMLEIARQAAMKLIALDPTLSRAEHAAMRERVRIQNPELAAIVVS